MRIVLLGGAPGIGKTAAARELLARAAGGDRLFQWVDVDALWLHQPWRVDEVTKAMVQQNLRAVLANARTAGVDDAVVTWVFQNDGMHQLVRSLAPPDVGWVTIQLVAAEATWRRRFATEGDRPPIDEFFELRYRQAQATTADHRLETDHLSARDTAAAISEILEVPGAGRDPGSDVTEELPDREG